MSHFLGEIILVGFDFAPPEFLPCDGRLLQIVTNIALFSLLETRFGGDGTRTFALPDYTRVAPRGSKYIICVQGVFPTRPTP